MVVCRAGVGFEGSSECLAGECGQNKCSLVDLLAVVPAKLLFLLGGPSSERLLEVAVGILAADHEADLARWVCGNRGVAILDVGEDFFARLLEVGDEGHMQPLVLSCTRSCQPKSKQAPVRRIDGLVKQTYRRGIGEGLQP